MPHWLPRVVALAAAAALVAFTLTQLPLPLHTLANGGSTRAWLTSARPHAFSAYYSGGVQQSLAQAEATSNPLPPRDHKPLWPLNARDVVMFGVTISAIFVAAGGGIGGGGVLVPLFILVGDFTTREAVALSNMSIMGGALANFCCNIMRKNSATNKPLIDWDLILVMEPATIVGALLGGYLNKLLPVWFTTTMLAALLTLMTHKLAAKGLQMYNKESHLLPLTTPLHIDHSPVDSDDEHVTHGHAVHVPHSAAHRHALHAANGHAANGHALNGHAANGLAANGHAANGHAANGHANLLDEADSLEAPLLPMVDEEGDGDAVGEYPRIGEQYDSQHQSLQLGRDALRALLKGEATQVPVMKIVVLLALSAWVVVSDTVKEEVPCGSWRYWAVVLSLLPCVVVVTLEMRRYLLWKGAVKAAHGYGQDELKWTPTTTLLYPLISSFAGLFAGLFGVGGGIVKGPLMLELGVRPDVAAATAATMILFTAGAACVIFVHFGGVVWDYAIPLVVLGFFVTLAGQLATYSLMQRLGRRSVIVFMMAALMAMATTIMYYQTATEWVDLARHPQEFSHIGHICVVHTSPGPRTTPGP